MAHTNKKILFVNRQAPHGTSTGQEALDILLMASALNQTINLVFLDDGVWQLKTQQNTHDIQQKNFTDAFKALPLYGIETIYVEQESLAARNLTAADMLLPVTICNAAEIAQLMTEHEVIFNF